MGDVLSQSEVEALLAALEPGGQGAAPQQPTKRDDGGQQVSVYDFKRPERVSKEQMRAFQALHEGFSREFGAALSGMLRTIVEVKLISVDQLTYSEFVFSLENPTCFNLLASEGLQGHLILDLNPSIVYPIIDRLLGGGKDLTITPPGRPLTDIELRLASRITKLAISGLQNAWSTVADLKLHVSQVESNPQLVQIVPPNEVVVLVSFELTMGEVRGIVNLCIPFNTIEPLSGKLTSDSWSAYQKRQNDPRQRIYLQANTTRSTVPVIVRLAETKLTAEELASLAVGDVILTERDQQAGVEVVIGGSPLFAANPGLVKGHKAIRITRKIPRRKDAVAEELRKIGLDPGEPAIPELAG